MNSRHIQNIGNSGENSLKDSKANSKNNTYNEFSGTEPINSDN